MKYLVLFVLSALIIFWEGLKAHVHPYLYSVITPIHYCENRKDTAFFLSAGMLLDRAGMCLEEQECGRVGSGDRGCRIITAKSVLGKKATVASF